MRASREVTCAAYGPWPDARVDENAATARRGARLPVVAVPPVDDRHRAFIARSRRHVPVGAFLGDAGATPRDRAIRNDEGGDMVLSDRTPVAGVGLALPHREQAEAVAEWFADAARAEGASSDGVVVGVHRAAPVGEEATAFSVSIEVAGAPEAQLWDLVLRACVGVAAHATWASVPATGEGVPWGAALGRRRAGEPGLATSASDAARAHEARSAGRVVRFAGCSSLVGCVAVGEMVAGSAIDEVVDLASGPLRPDDLVLVRDPVRPRWQFGSLVLHVLAAPGTGDAAVFLPLDRQGRALAAT